MLIPPTPLRTKASKAKPGLLSRHKRLRWLVICVLFFAAVSIRMYHIDSSATEWYPERQYYSAWGARCMYYSSLDSIPDWRKDVIEAYPRMVDYADNSGMMAPLPTIEGIARLLYSLAGGEYMWLPRAFSALAWVLGGVFLYLLAKRLMSKEAALLATGFYLLLPAGITGGRSFQVEPLMVAAMICSVYAIFLHHEKPTARRVLVAASVAAVAVLTRPLCAFMIFGAFVALSLKRRGLRRAMRDPHSWLFASIAVLPTAILILYDRLFPFSSSMTYFEGSTVQPHLLLHWDYYFQWAYYFLSVIGSWGISGAVQILAGLVTLGAAVVGATILRKKDARPLVIGLSCGFVAFGIVFTYLISNHHYHQLQMVPVIALCLGPIAVRILTWVYALVADLIGPKWVSRVAVGGILFVLVIPMVGVVADDAMRSAELGRERGVEAQTIGELVEHSTDVVVISHWRGYDLTYHGWFFGHWLLWETPALQGADVVHMESFFDSLCEGWQPTYLVITDLEELDRHSVLRQFLFATYPTVAQADAYLILNLQESLGSPGDPS